MQKPRPTTVSRAKIPERLEGHTICERASHKAQRQVEKTCFNMALRLVCLDRSQHTLY